MGWLRDLMRSCDPPLTGYGELARRALAHPEWPADTQPQWRSLAALFSKLDRGIELEWLADRAGAQRALALVLGCQLSEVQRPLAAVTQADAAHRIRLEDAPFARPLDLTEEPLPPGIPPEVLRPAAWARTWWAAPPGSGRSLVGQWLVARGLASFASGVRCEDIAAQLPEAGPVFIEVEQPAGIEPLLERRSLASVCVAAPTPPPEPRHPSKPSSAWRVVSAPSMAETALPLCRWLEARLPRDGAFDAEAAARWLEAPLREGLLPTFGALLGAAGLLDARGLRHAADKTLVQLAAELVAERLRSASGKGSAEAQWLGQHGADVLVRLARAVLTTRDEPWDRARSLDEWIALIPAELQQSVDGAWVQWSLARGSAGVLPDVERALRTVPPGAYRIVRALADARILRERGPDARLALCPEFLKHAVLAHARRELVSEPSPFGWGEALLRPNAAPCVLDALAERLATGDLAPLDALLELDISTEPALVVALEAAFVCIGLRSLEGGGAPSEVLLALWNEQLTRIVELPDELPRPRLLCFDAAIGAHPLAEHGAWALAALAISERLAEGSGKRHPVLRPWVEVTPAPALLRLLDAIHALVTRGDVAPRSWALAAFAIAGKLEARFSDTGPMESAEQESALQSHPLCRPARSVRALLDGDDIEPLATLIHTRVELEALRAECARRDVDWPRMARAIWRRWFDAGCPLAGDALLGPRSASPDLFWPYLTAEVLDLVWGRWAPDAELWPFELFGQAQWAAFTANLARRARTAGDISVWRRAFELMDEECVTRVVEQVRLLDAAEGELAPLLSSAWTRFPSRMRALLDERLEASDVVAVGRVLHAAPVAAGPALVAALASALARRSTTRALIDVARGWLTRSISARVPEWRAAYTLLVELDARVERAQRARGVA